MAFSSLFFGIAIALAATCAGCEKLTPPPSTATYGNAGQNAAPTGTYNSIRYELACPGRSTITDNSQGLATVTQPLSIATSCEPSPNAVPATSSTPKPDSFIYVFTQPPGPLQISVDCRQRLAAVSSVPYRGIVSAIDANGRFFAGNVPVEAILVDDFSGHFGCRADLIATVQGVAVCPSPNAGTIATAVSQNPELTMTVDWAFSSSNTAGTNFPNATAPTADPRAHCQTTNSCYVRQSIYLGCGHP